MRPIPDLVDSVVEDVKLLRKCASCYLLPCLQTLIAICLFGSAPMHFDWLCTCQHALQADFAWLALYMHV